MFLFCILDPSLSRLDELASEMPLLTLGLVWPQLQKFISKMPKFGSQTEQIFSRREGCQIYSCKNEILKTVYVKLKYCLIFSPSTNPFRLAALSATNSKTLKAPK